MRSILPLVLILLISANLSYSQVQIGNDINGQSNELIGYSLAMSSDGTIVATGAPGHSSNGRNSGIVRIYKYDRGTWTQLGRGIVGLDSFDASGKTIALSADGTIVAIGASGSAGKLNSGYVRIFQYISNEWIQLGSELKGALDDGFGNSVALSSDGLTLAVGAAGSFHRRSPLGYFKVYKYQSGSWSQFGRQISVDITGDAYTSCVALSAQGKTLAVGHTWSTGNDPPTGRVKIYREINSEWQQMGKDIDGFIQRCYNGRGLSISEDGKICAVGRRINTRVYQFDSVNWVQLGDDISLGTDDYHSCGSLSLSSNGKVLAIGTGGNVNDIWRGVVRIYKNQNGIWRKLGQDINGLEDNDRCGEAVAISNDGLKVAAGSLTYRINDSLAGQVRVFELSDALIQEPMREQGFAISSNRISDYLIVTIEAQNLGANFKIFNNLGQNLKQGTLTNLSQTIDLTELATGYYYIGFMDGIETYKFLVE